jgi:uncharacterized protein YfdQ (DUF2303 family)
MTDLDTDISALRDLILSGLQPEPMLPAVLIPQGHTLQSLEPFQPAPARLRGTFETPYIEEFGAYLDASSRVLDPQTSIFVDPKSMRAVARLDHGVPIAPGWGDHRAVLTLQATPAYLALTQINERPLTQEQILDWLVDWADHVDLSRSAPEDDVWEPMPLPAALYALRNLATKATQERTSEISDTARTKTALEQAAITSAPPRALRFTCKCYDELAPRALLARLSYLPQDPPRVSLRLLGHAEHVRALAEEFTATLRDLSKTYACAVYLGTFANGNKSC